MYSHTEINLTLCHNTTNWAWIFWRLPAGPRYYDSLWAIQPARLRLHDDCQLAVAARSQLGLWWAVMLKAQLIDLVILASWVSWLVTGLAGCSWAWPASRHHEVADIMKLTRWVCELRCLLAGSGCYSSLRAWLAAGILQDPSLKGSIVAWSQIYFRMAICNPYVHTVHIHIEIPYPYGL